MPLLTIFGWLTDLVSEQWWTYLLVFGVALADAVLPLVPSETIVILAGIAASTGGLHLWLVIVAAWAGVVLGDNLSYLLGSSLGEPAYRRLFSGDEGKRHYEWAHRVLDGQGALDRPDGAVRPGRPHRGHVFRRNGVDALAPVLPRRSLAAGLIWATYSACSATSAAGRSRAQLEVVCDGVRDRRRDRARRHRLLARRPSGAPAPARPGSS